MRNFFSLLASTFRWQDIVEIIVLAFIIYRGLIFIRATRALQVLKGLGLIFFAGLLAHLAELQIINMLLRSLLGISVIALIIVFQPELRRMLAHFGKKPGFSTSITELQMIEEIVKSASLLADKKRGALIIIEDDTGLEEIIETGVPVGAGITAELVESIFARDSSLHDGAVVISEGRLAAAACIISLSEAKPTRSTGLRHLAALSAVKDTDAFVIVISEETGEISIAYKGVLKRNISENDLRTALTNIYRPQDRKWKFLKK